MSSIDEAVSTLLEHTKGVDFELYTVDNLSTDGTPDHIKKTYGAVKVIEPGTNKGFGSGHNEVLSVIDSKYHCVINPDISINEDVIAKMVEYMEAHPEIGLLSPKICFPDGRSQILGKRNPKIKYLVASRMRDEANPSPELREYAMLDCDLSKPIDIENATGCFMFIRTKLFKEIGGFDKRYFMYFEDSDLTREVNSRCRTVYYPEATVYHEWGRESKKNFKLKLVQINSMLNFFAKWGLK